MRPFSREPPLTSPINQSVIHFRLHRPNTTKHYWVVNIGSISEEKLSKLDINRTTRTKMMKMGINTIGVLLFTPAETFKHNEIIKVSESRYDDVVKYLRKMFNIV